MLPIIGRSEQLLQAIWIEQMLPSFEESCLYDSNPIKACVLEGWSMLVHAGQAITGRWAQFIRTARNFECGTFNRPFGGGGGGGWDKWWARLQ